MSSHESMENQKLSSFPIPALDADKSSKAKDSRAKDTNKTSVFNYEEKKGKLQNFKRPSDLTVMDEQKFNEPVSDEDQTRDLIKQRVKLYFTRILDKVE